MDHLGKSVVFAAIMTLIDEMRDRQKQQENWNAALRDAQLEAQNADLARRKLIRRYKQEAIDFSDRLILAADQNAGSDSGMTGKQMLDMLLESVIFMCVNQQYISAEQKADDHDLLVSIAQTDYLSPSLEGRDIYPPGEKISSSYADALDLSLRLYNQGVITAEISGKLPWFAETVCKILYGMELYLQETDTEADWPGNKMILFFLDHITAIADEIKENMWRNLPPEEKKKADFDRWSREEGQLSPYGRKNTMTELDAKILDIFPGKVVRKDLTSLMKKGANVPTYVLEYLLGMYCATDDEEAIEIGLGKIRKILSENYVRPDQSEYVKSKIKENGQYTIIDKITVVFDDREDKYVARFTNLRMDPFEVPSDLVVHNEKLLIGGIWCIIKIEYVGLDNEGSEDQEEFEEDIFGDKKRKKKTKKKKSKYASPFVIDSLKPIQMPNLDLDEMKESRANFTKDEWISLLLRSAGYEPDELTEKEKLHYLLRFVPFIQKNYNLVELGPRGTGKSHVYSELSPYSILMSSGTTTVSNMFYNMASRRVGLVGNWDCIAFDEVAGITQASGDMVQIMKNYMANGSFARGADSISSDASIAFEGNTFRSVADMMRTTNLFEPFPDAFNNDSAFFDRIHAYLPGWETPKLRSGLFTKRYGLISDCFSEFCHAMRKYDFTNSFSEYFTLNREFNTRDTIAVGRTFSGLAKLIYPDEQMSKEEVREILEYAIECRRRVKEQLRKMTPGEFSDVDLGYIDLDTNEEHVVLLPEVSSDTLIYQGFEKPGYVYGIGRSVSDILGVYRLENKLVEGSGKFSFKNVEGLAKSPKTVRDSLNAAFNYFSEHSGEFISGYSGDFDYSLYFNDLQSRGVSDEISVAEVVGLFSGLARRAVTPALIICGRVVMSGSMMPITTALDEIFVTAANAGAKTIMLPAESKSEYDKLKSDLKEEIDVVFYTTPVDAAKKALGVDL